MLVVFGNCSTVASKEDQYSMVGEDYVCEEDDAKDCKYPIESY
jgi:hypothetical protein